MNATIEINMDNDAFAIDDGGEELGRILKELAITISQNGFIKNYNRPLYDKNGNGIGSILIA